jgi:hypothetical protein
VAAVAFLAAPSLARANGDPASDYLLVQNVFLPFNAKVDAGVSKRLSGVIRASDSAGLKVRVALIGTRYDLGTAYSLYNKPQRYAAFLGLELSFVYRGHLIVVMPNGFGSSVAGKPDRPGIRALAQLPAPGKDATKQAQAATTAVLRLASAYGHTLPAGGVGIASQTRDRIKIAAGVTILVVLLAGIVLFRRERAAARS